jgi:hypothetical protein
MLENLYFLSPDADMGEGAGVNDAQTADVQENEDITTNEETTEGEGDTTSTVEEEKPFKNDPQNKAFAELRRRAEEAEKRAKSADEWVESQYGKSHNLHTWQDYQNALAQQEQEQLRVQVEEAGVDPEILNQYINNNPVIKQANQIMQQQQQEALMRQLNDQVEEVSREFPESNIKTVQDYMAQPNYPQMLQLVQRGYTLADAYEKVNRTELRKKAAESAKQATLNNVNSKGHLKSPQGSTDIDITSVPQETLKLYKQWFPKMSDSDIVKHYKSSL